MLIDEKLITKEIKIACETINAGGFKEYYHSLVNQFTERDDMMTYQQFANQNGRGTLPITSDDLAFCYSVAYEAAHRAAFDAVLHSELVIESKDTMINIIDYGCGQGVATITMLEYIASKQDATKIQLNIYLIEPSKIALNNAGYKISLWAEKLGFKSACIDYQNHTLEESRLPNIDNTGDVMHLMSYILDVPEIQSQLDSICQQILQLPNQSIIIATCPDIAPASYGFRSIVRKLSDTNQDIYEYYTEHESYRWLKGCYDFHTTKAIGIVMILNNQTLDNL